MKTGNWKKTDNYAKQQVSQTVSDLQVDPEHGLDDAAIRKRQEQYGYNEIHEKEESLWHRIFRRFWGLFRG